MLKQLLFFGGFVFLLILVTVYLLQRHLIYFPETKIPSRRVFHAEDMQSINLTTSDNLKLNAWYKPAVINMPTILYLHGNGGHIGYRMYLVRHLLYQGYGVLLPDYRGYGGNPGKPTEEGLYLDGRAAMDFLQEHAIKNSRIVLYGESLGTGVATKLASEFPACALILQSPFTSLPAVARFHYPWLLIPPTDKYDSLGRINNIHMPILFLHGKQDEIVPYYQGKQLFNQANDPKQWVEFSKRGHEDLWDTKFVGVVTDFIKQSNSRCLNTP